MRSTRILLTTAFLFLLALPPAVSAKPHDHRHAQPLVIGHRGASGYRPEHTLESYRLAAEQGADYIEPDLVSTKDGVLVARHEPEIGGTTDVADHPEFADRRTTKMIDGVEFIGWFTEDFTLEELKTLRAKERIPALRPANAAYDGQFEIPTFQEVLDLRERLSRNLRRPLGVYPETKHPTYFRTLGLPLEPALVRTLNRYRLNDRRAPVFVQSFETGNLRALQPWLKVPLVQLLGAPGERPVGDPRTYAELATPGRPAQHRALRRRRRALEGLHRAPQRRSVLSPADALRQGRARGRPRRPSLHVPAREQLPAARAALVRRTRGHRRPAVRATPVLRPRRRRRVHRQPRHRSREPPPLTRRVHSSQTRLVRYHA